MAQAPSRSIIDMMFGKGYGDNAVKKEEEERKKREAERKRIEEENRKKRDSEGKRVGGVRGSAAANDLYS